MVIHGGCLCGAVRYQYDGDPMMVFECHCRDCQQHGGSHVHYGIMVREAEIRIEGVLSSYEKPADSGRTISRHFCPVCGSGVCNRPSIAPGTVVIKGGTIDDLAARPTPTFALYTATECAWQSASLRRFSRNITVSARELRWQPPVE